MRNALMEDLARQRAAELTRAAREARAARGATDSRRDSLLASVRAVLARRPRSAVLESLLARVDVDAAAAGEARERHAAVLGKLDCE